MLRFRSGFFVCVCSLVALIASFSPNAAAQQVFGSIIGTVTDPSGSAVANAKVTVADVTKGTSSEVMTNDAGQYSKGQLIPDQYTVTVEAPGFQKVVSNALTVQVDQATQFNASLQVGNVDQTVEVTAAAPLLQTDRADVAQTFTSQQISQIPSIGRNLQAFELLQPGTVKTQWGHAADENPQGSQQSYTNGLPFYMTGYYLDGTVNQDPILGIIVINPTFDSVNEVKQNSQVFDAEFDSTGAGLYTYSTKSGTNAFHGDLFEYIFLNTPGFQDFGRNPFTENSSAGVPTTHQNQFGGSLGGRVIKDKLFFFADTQITRNIQGGSILTSVPTLQERSGNLGDWLTLGSQYQIYDPNTGNQTTAAGRSPFPGNVIPPGRLSPQALAIMNYFPLPNYFGSGSSIPYNNYSANGSGTVDGNVWNTRWDYYLNEKNTFFGRYSYAGFTKQAPGAFGDLAGGPAFNGSNYGGSSQALNQSGAAGWTYTKSATTINEFRFGYERYHITDVPNGYGQSPATAAGIPNLNTSLTTSGLPAFNIENPNSGNEELGYSLTINQCNCPLTELERQYQFVDNLSHIAGKHSFKFGADVRYAENLRVPSDNHRAGELNFLGSNTAQNGSTGGGLALATFLLGQTSSFNRYVSSTLDAEERQKRLFWYGQDEWRPTQKLTVTYGVRWEMVFPETVNGPGNGAELNLNTGVLDVFGTGLNSSSGYQSMNWHNFAPRIGVAYQLNQKTVVRAGYGWTYSLGTFGSTFGHNVTQNPPILANQALTQQSQLGNNFGNIFSLSQGPPAPPTFTVSPQGTLPCPQGVDCKTRPGIFTMPVAYIYNFSVQHQLTSKISVQGSYVGNAGRHGPLGNNNSFDNNQVFYVPGFTGNQNTLRPFDGLFGPRYNYGITAALDNYCNCANSRYDSFQGIFTVKAMAGYTLQGNYTYQLSQGDGNGPTDPSYTFLYDRPLGYGNVANLPNQEWILVNNYDIPFGRGRRFGAKANRFVDAALGGWNISGVFSYYSGLSYTPTVGTYPAAFSADQPYTGPNNVPNIGSGNPYAANPNRNQWNVGWTNQGTSGPFLLPLNSFGNYPLNTLYGPQFVNLDAAIMKVFSITERLKFQLRMDATNSLNHTNLGLPNNDVSSPNAGQITNIAFSGNGGSMRRLQYSGTFNW
jgi:hypothetical protein